MQDFVLEKYLSCTKAMLHVFIESVYAYYHSYICLIFTFSMLLFGTLTFFFQGTNQVLLIAFKRKDQAYYPLYP
jgi:hypothetical protein